MLNFNVMNVISMKSDTEEESHSEEIFISIDEQVQDRISVSTILGYCNCDRIFSYDTSITRHEEISYQEVVF
jgi:hypothetical protein